MKLARYKCHKIVHAGQIVDSDLNGQGDNILVLKDDPEPLIVSEDYMHKHMPQKGGYYLVYEDGYESFSPAGPFEAGYTRID